MERSHRFIRALLALVVVAVSGAAVAQSYPTRAVRFILPFPPGGPTDILGRAIAQQLSQQMGKQVVPDNRPGAGGNLGLELLSKAAADGYTIGLSSSAFAISPSMYRKLNYKQSDLAPISLVAEIPNVLVVHPSVPAKSIQELIALARENPGKLTFGSGGVGTTTHLTPERIMSITKVKMLHIPYKGSGLALVSLVAGEIDLLIMTVPAAQGQIKAGRARALVVFATERASALPDVPSAKEAGVENYIVQLWYGIFAPARTPANLINRLNAEIRKAMNAPALKARLEGISITPRTSTPGEFARFIAEETPRYAKLVKDAGIKPR
jgi:tripartite-type tricarboxylate transporter receptor subunit TctC